MSVMPEAAPRGASWRPFDGVLRPVTTSSDLCHFRLYRYVKDMTVMIHYARPGPVGARHDRKATGYADLRASGDRSTNTPSIRSTHRSDRSNRSNRSNSTQSAKSAKSTQRPPLRASADRRPS